METVYNRALDVTACVNIPVKLVTTYLILTKTPRHLRHDSFFILNVVFWTFAGNFFTALAHLYPTYPAHCYRIVGPLSLLVDNEIVGQVMFHAIFVCVLHSALGLFVGFVYRYVAFVHPQSASRIKPIWAFGLCALTHVAIFALYSVVVVFSPISYDDYPYKYELPSREFLFCLFPYGWRKIMKNGLFFVVISAGLTAIVTLASLLFREIYRKSGIINQKTLRMQRRLLWNLIILTSIVVLFGGVPLVTSLLVAWFPHIPYANTITVICVVVIANHGTIYAIATLILFKQYRQAFSKMLGKASLSFYNTTQLFVKVQK